MKRFEIVAAVVLMAAMGSAPGLGARAKAQSTPGSTAAQADGTAKKARHAKAHKETAEELQLDELRQSIKAQQVEIDELKAILAGKAADLTTAQQTATEAQTQAAAAAASAAAASAAAADSNTKVDALSSSVTDLKSTDQGLQETVIANQGTMQAAIESPAAIHYKGVTITPVAFFAFEGVYRERSLNSDINTPFNSIPFPSANEGHVSELNFSGRQSRLGGLFEGNAGTFKLSGYFEADFLSSGTTSNNNQSNSYTLRQRQIWGKAETAGGFAVTGGQTWSLVTEDGKSTDVRTEKLPNTIDAQYMVGFSWERQPGLRLQQRFGDIKTGALTVAVAAEQAQITSFTATSATTGALPANFFFAGAGTGGGLYNAYSGTYANNVAPDVVVKAAYDLPKAHFELGGVGRFMRDYYFPILTSTPTFTAGALTAVAYSYSPTSVSNTAAAGGVFGSARVTTSKYLDVALQAMAGTGTGRYGSAQLADATIKPSGALEPIRNYHSMFSLEGHATPKLDVFAYYGGEYAQRTIYTTSLGATLGYGARNLNDAGCYALPSNPGTSTGGSPASPGTCASPTRFIQEGMFGLTYRVANSPKFGRLQYSMTYSYLQRNLWSGLGSTVTPSGPRALENMVHAGMRYYIP